MKKLSLSIILLLITILTYGQDQWLVTSKMDTIYGRIFIDTGDPVLPDAARITNASGKNIHKAYELLSVHLGPGEDYETLKIDNRYQFAKVNLPGDFLSRYLYKDPELGSTSNFSMPILVNWKGEQYKVGRMTSRKKFAEYMKDCPSLKEQILNKNLKKSKEMEVIILRYNMCIEEIRNQPKEEIVQKKLTPIEKFELFISDLKTKELYNEDLIPMLNDIEQKIQAEQFIPKYLQQVVLTQLGSYDELKKQFLDIVEN